MARAMLEENNTSKKLWAKALSYACLINNILPTEGLKDTTPWNKWHNTAYDVSKLKTFGCE
eukprot:Pgem_evm1s15916